MASSEARITFSPDETEPVHTYVDVRFRLPDANGKYPPGLAAYGRGKSSPDTHQNFTREVRDALIAIGAEWARRHPNGPRIMLGEGSIVGGGPHWPHKSHQTGFDVDVLIGRKDRKEGLDVLDAASGRSERVTIDHPQYSAETTAEMIDVIALTSSVPINRIFFADPKGVRKHTTVDVNVQLEGSHRKHFHVRFESTRASVKVDDWNVPSSLRYGDR